MRGRGATTGSSGGSRRTARSGARISSKDLKERVSARRTSRRTTTERRGTSLRRATMRGWARPSRDPKAVPTSPRQANTQSHPCTPPSHHHHHQLLQRPRARWRPSSRCGYPSGEFDASSNSLEILNCIQVLGHNTRHFLGCWILFHEVRVMHNSMQRSLLL